MTPRISLITPVFNGEEHLHRCVESIVAAAEGHSVELLIVDDGSTDGTPEIALRYSEVWPWIRYLRQPNAGPSSARNAGLELARGDYIGFVDSDDCVAPAYFNRLFQVCVDSPELVVFGYERRLLDGSTSVLAPLSRRHVDESDLLLGNVSNDRELFWYPATKLFRADVVRSIRFNERIRLGEDTIFNLQAVANARVVVRISDVLHRYYETAGSLSSPTYKAGLLENMEEHFAARLLVHTQRGQVLAGHVRADLCQYYLGHIVPWLVSNAMRMDKREQLGELAKVRSSQLVTTCFSWGAKVDGSRGLTAILLLLKFRMLRLLRSMLASKAKPHSVDMGGETT
ncbi:glycosyltransferase [Halomonas sp. MC140]|nr:glycosyltransferase [Halomonas sp. MC140]MDN7131509.1 glycosyltransferase [Halomonas sp. MC140]